MIKRLIRWIIINKAKLKTKQILHTSFERCPMRFFSSSPSCSLCWMKITRDQNKSPAVFICDECFFFPSNSSYISGIRNQNKWAHLIECQQITFFYSIVIVVGGCFSLLIFDNLPIGVIPLIHISNSIQSINWSFLFACGQCKHTYTHTIHNTQRIATLTLYSTYNDNPYNVCVFFIFIHSGLWIRTVLLLFFFFRSLSSLCVLCTWILDMRLSRWVR